MILLMFGVGLHFHIEDLLAVRRVALPGAVVQIGAAADGPYDFESRLERALPHCNASW